ncbi:MAG TPA: type VI secretion system tip protein VgrG, partial [Noviherbaspirillum sp.]|uniref:DUF2345 domain-containing protein n=1 Tax=Noviherbaspirillum sp. TaxID=1926288 RepID=UPI002DDDB4C0
SLYARNNLPADLSEAARPLLQPVTGADIDTLGAASAEKPLSEPVYRTRFDAVRKGIPIIPAYSHTEHAKPVAPSLMTAIVVGPPGEEIHTDALGRIRVRMGFTRLQDHQHAEGAGATDSDRDSPWIRVAQSWSGTEYGHVWIPRVGDEVLIQYINGDIDRPIVTASVYNGTHRPATFSDAGNLPGNKTLSGIKSKMVKGSGHNEIVWDDSTAEQRIRVATDHANSALNQGFLVHPRVGGKGEPRGEGFELRSDDYGAIRAGKGLLVSTDVRENARSTHLDSKELTTQLKGALELSTVLSDAAKDHHADMLEVNEEAQRLLQVAEKTYSQSGGTGQKAEVAGYEEPVMAFSSPAGILSATPKTQQITAGENIHISSQKDTNVAIGKRLAMAIRESWSVFVATAGIKLFAGKGKVQIQAQDDNIEITARKDVRIASIAANINIGTPNSLTLTAGGCQIRMSGGTIDIKAPGPVNIHGSIKHLTSPAGGSYSGALPAVPMKKGDMVLEHLYENGEPVKGAKYKVTLAGGEVRAGVLDGAGKAVLAGIPKGAAAVEYAVDPRRFEHKPDWEASLPDFDASDLKTFEPSGAQAISSTLPAGGIAKNAAGLAGQAAGLIGKATQHAKSIMATADPSALADKAAQAAGLSGQIAGAMGAMGVAANVKSGADLAKTATNAEANQAVEKAASIPIASALRKDKPT